MLKNVPFLKTGSLQILFCLLGFYGGLHAQVIEPPQFLCVRNDTLIWTPTGNNCGPFVSYQIYAGPTEFGPFSLFATITNQTQTTFYNPVPPGQTVFYFIRSVYNCPGFVSLNSDTLDNILPLSPEISAVSVNQNGSVTINWQPSPSPEVVGYIIYQQTNIGLTPIDTVYGISAFTHFATDANDAAQQYTIVAFDACGNAGLFGVNHQTAFLQGAVNPCEQSFDLTWSAYTGWPAGIDQQVVWVSINGSPWAPTDTIAGSATSFSLPAISSGLNYCIRIVAKQNGNSFGAQSNTICLSSDIVQPVNFLTLQNATLLPSALTEWFWSFNSNAALTDTKIQRFDEVLQNWVDVLSVPNAQIVGNDNYKTANITTANRSAWRYRVVTTDACNKPVVSNTASSIFLQGSPAGAIANNLEWSPYQNDLGTCQQYEVFRTLDNFTSSVGLTDPGVTQFSDIIDGSNPDFFRACYYVVAHALVDQDNGSTLPVKTRSNSVCIDQVSRIFAPTAFAPRGINQIFKPVIQYPELIKSYAFFIYDRWGQEIFATNDVETGWDGKIGNLEAPAGQYVFYIRLIQTDGRVAKKRETLSLIR